MTFIHDRVGRGEEEKLGVGRNLQGLARKKLSLGNSRGQGEASSPGKRSVAWLPTAPRAPPGLSTGQAVDNTWVPVSVGRPHSGPQFPRL